MATNPYKGSRVTDVMRPGMSHDPVANDQSSKLGPHEMGQFRPGAQGQPSLGDGAAMRAGQAGRPLPIRDDDADQVVDSQGK